MNRIKLSRTRYPVLTELNPVNVYEHTPLRPWIAEYPRFIRPVRPPECRFTYTPQSQPRAAPDTPA